MVEQKRVTIIAPVHIYSDIRVFQKEAVTLAKAGYAVTLIARNKMDTIDQGVRVIALPQVNRTRRFLQLPSVFLKALKLRAHVYHLHNPDTLPLAFALKVFGKKVIYDTHEDFSKRILIRYWIPAPLRRVTAFFISNAERLAGFLFDSVIVTQEEIKERIPSPQVTVIQNPPLTNSALIEVAKEIACNLRFPDGFKVIYIGTIEFSRGLDTMVQAIGLLNETHPATLILAGDFSEQAEFERIRKHPFWKHVIYTGLLPQKQAFAHLLHADAGLAVIKNMADYAQTSPNKIFEYQTFGVPFIASDFPKWQQQLSATDSGLFVPPEDPGALAAAMRQLAENKTLSRKMGENGRRFILSEFNWEKESAKLLRIYDRLIGDHVPETEDTANEFNRLKEVRRDNNFRS